ncbi:MAG: hypothetical protein C5B50_20875 [Verrucomicrobia bacterium]|nr:MAG: hypothetical protein C5B50_20875 [Verrucomicrobiota bacterium]
MLREINIIGGGLAGLTLGIGLRQRGVPVTVFESGHYPRHRVCGEFISGRGQDALARLGLRDLLIEAGTVPAKTAIFFLGDTASPVRPIPRPALCISRFVLDALLAGRFRELGGNLFERQSWRESGLSEGCVRASGRRIQAHENGWKWFGLKIHARDVPLTADLEMHGSSKGYVGMSRLPGDEINICGLFRRPAAGSESAPPWQEMLRGQKDSAHRHRVENASFDQASFCSVAALPLRPRRARASSECCIGDALTMIPPVTGNGMSMAFESAEIAAEPLAAYSRNELSWSQAQIRIARDCDAAFAQRLAWAKCLQWMMFTLLDRGRLAHIVLCSDLVWRWMFAKTR